MPKYTILTDAEHTKGNLKQIQALVDFSDVKKGNCGGWIEKEENLSQSGNCWVYDDAEVSGESSIEDDVQIRGHAKIHDSIIVGKVKIFDNVEVENAILQGLDFEISGNARIENGYVIARGTRMRITY